MCFEIADFTEVDLKEALAAEGDFGAELIRLAGVSPLGNRTRFAAMGIGVGKVCA